MPHVGHGLPRRQPAGLRRQRWIKEGAASPCVAPGGRGKAPEMGKIKKILPQKWIKNGQNFKNFSLAAPFGTADTLFPLNNYEKIASNFQFIYHREKIGLPRQKILVTLLPTDPSLLTWWHACLTLPPGPHHLTKTILKNLIRFLFLNTHWLYIR